MICQRDLICEVNAEKGNRKKLLQFAKCHAFQIIYSRALYAADGIGVSERISLYGLTFDFSSKKTGSSSNASAARRN
jgi:hypothetical protein